MEGNKTGPYRWVILALIALVYLSVGPLFFAPAPLFPLVMQTYGVDRATVGLLIGGTLLAQAALTVPSSVLASRFGIGRTFTLGLILLATQAAVPLTTHFYQLLILRLIFGAGTGIVMPLAGGLLFRWFPGGPMPLLTGLSFTSIGIGNGLGLLVAVPLANLMGWEGALGILGLSPVLVTFLWLFLGRVRGQEIGVGAPSVPFRESFRVMRGRNTLLVGFGVIGPWAATTALLSWLPTFYYEVRGVPLQEAGLFLSTAILATVPLTLLAGILSTRVGLRRPFLLIPGLLMAITGLGTFLFPNLSLAFIAFFIFYATSRLYHAALFSIPSELPGMTTERVAVVWAMVFALGGLFSFISPPLVGFIRDQTGSFTPGLVAGALVSLTLALAGLLLPETGPRVRTRAAATKEA